MTDTRDIRQLERRLADCNGDSSADVHQKIDALNTLAWALSDTDLKRAQTLSETALALAESMGDGAAPYLPGVAYSLRTQGYLHQRFGDHPLGLVQLLRAREIFESLHLDDGLADVFDGIAGIYFQIGNFPESLSYIYKQLETAQRLGDKRLIANAYNNLANIYFETGDYDRAIETLHHNLQVAGEIHYPRIEALSYLNLAETHQLAGNYDQALKNALQALSLSQKANFELFEVYTFDFIGKSYLKLGHTARAIHALEHALKLSRKVESKVTEALILLNLGQAYRDTHQVDLALNYLQQGIATAQNINAGSEMFKCHLLLSEIYEQQGNLALALDHYKQYQAIKETILGKKSDQRLKVLQVAHDANAARAEARFLQVKTAELQREVTERTRAQAQAQRQLDYARALSACSQRLLATSVSQADNRITLVEALGHLIKPTQASKIYLYENFDDPELGLCSRFIIDACAPGTTSLLDTSNLNHYTQVIPWSITPAENRRRMTAGEPVGGPVKTVFASTPSFRDYLLNQEHVLSVQFFPIHFGEHWWGYVGFDDRVNEREWGEEEILLLSTAAEMLSSTLQRWQVEEKLRQSNNRLEQQVRLRTLELHETIELLQQEINERQQAQAQTQQVLATLERRVAARTEELATFFDLTVLAGHAANLADVFEQALPRILEVSRSRAVCLHLLEANGAGLRLAAQQNLPAMARPLLQHVTLPPNFQEWLQHPHDPLVTTDMSHMFNLPATFRLQEFQSYLGAQIRVGGRVEGLLSCYRFTPRGFGLDEISLVVALAEQLGMVLETHRLRQNTRDIAVLEERQRLARDLHDSVTQSLYSLSLFSRAGLEAAADGDAARLNLSLTELERNTLYALREMRLLLYELRPADLEAEGLKRAVELRLNTVERRVGLQLDAHLDDLPIMLSHFEVELYHIIVEALNNVVKHAAASHLTLRLTTRCHHFQLLIADDGRGFDPAQSTGGLGLRNIRERVARLQGRLVIASQPGGGVRLEADIPFQREET